MDGGRIPVRIGLKTADFRLPAQCVVRGVLDPRMGVGGIKYGLGFELRMPASWNGRFLFQGDAAMSISSICALPRRQSGQRSQLRMCQPLGFGKIG